MHNFLKYPWNYNEIELIDDSTYGGGTQDDTAVLGKEKTYINGLLF